ncbi:Hsp70 family protein [Bradyrhizobium sp. STM 3562]|uniref:Hsp70 family protein n=1 Tax=Bradyrhizobium sp. STM 3562 TaxID=578924 RepID=UPI0038909518
MSSAPPAVSIGVDFGTSNTVVALSTGDGHVEAVRFDHGGQMHSVYVSALCFWEERPGAGLHPRAEGGPWAIEQFLEGRTIHRFIQSFKTFAASSAFNTTQIFRQRYKFEDLLAAFLRTLERHAGDGFDLGAPTIMVGRPVRFAGGNPDDALAMQRYRAAFDRVGAGHARYVYEPVGAAFSFARQLERDATVLVADFGGGTSDFSIMRFSRSAGGLRAEPLGHAGIGIAGDTFDYRIVDHIVSPRLGKGSSYRSFDKVLPIPNHYYSNLARWHQLAMMRGNGDLRELQQLARTALNPDPLQDFITIVDLDLGFSLYRAVSDTKVALSSRDSVDFRFQREGIDIGATVTRDDFEDWIADDLARLGATVDEVLVKAGISAQDVEMVFLTGGTSFVPAVQRLFAERFGEERVRSADQFEAIACGLALIGHTSDPDRWTVAGQA